jgi:hypothetical protein
VLAEKFNLCFILFGPEFIGTAATLRHQREQLSGVEFPGKLSESTVVDSDANEV